MEFAQRAHLSPKVPRNGTRTEAFVRGLVSLLFRFLELAPSEETVDIIAGIFVTLLSVMLLFLLLWPGNKGSNKFVPPQRPWNE